MVVGSATETHLSLQHDAMYLGLMESCVISTLLLQSGFNLD
jgi:hypothetical protein